MSRLAAGPGDTTCRLHSRPWSAFTVSCMAAARRSLKPITQAYTHPNSPLLRAAAPGRAPEPPAATGSLGPASGLLCLIASGGGVPCVFRFVPARGPPGVTEYTTETVQGAR